MSPKIQFCYSLQQKQEKKNSFSKLQCGRKKASLASIAQCIRMNSLLHLIKNG